MYCYLDGFPGWQKAGHPVETMKDFLPSIEIPTVSPGEAKALLDGKKAVLVDIRDNEDRKGGSVEGEIFIPLENLMADHGKIPQGSPVIVMDLRGAQTPIAGRYLVKQGIAKVSRVDGGFEAWVAGGLPVRK